MTTPTEPADLSHLSDEQFNALSPQGYHGVGDCKYYRSEQPQPEPERLADEELDNIYWDESWRAGADDPSTINEVGLSEFRLIARAVLARFARPAIEPVPVSERFEFSVLNSEYEEQAGGTAPTYIQALSEGEHYLSVYSQDGPHTLELRRVQVLPHHALPLPTNEQ